MAVRMPDGPFIHRSVIDLHGSDDPEPIFVLKAKDNLTLETIRRYRERCEAHGLTDQVRQVNLATDEIYLWRKRNIAKCKMPEHEHVPAAQRTEAATSIDEASERLKRRAAIGEILAEIEDLIRRVNELSI